MKRAATAALALVLAVLAGMFGTDATPTARAATPGPTNSLLRAPFTGPYDGALLNNPAGTADQQKVLLDYLGSSIDLAPAGSVIRMAVYSFSYQPMADQLLRAHQRGVQVRLIIDSHAGTAQITQLTKALGSSLAKTSYVRTCKYGCMSSLPSFMHSKLYMFSTSGQAKKVSMISSANPALSGGTQAWNNTYTIVGNPDLYNANLDNFNDMLADKTNTSYYKTAESGPYKLYYFPRGGTDSTSDTYQNVLSSVRCTGAAPGYGSNGRTSIKIAMYRWTSLRKNLAQKLWQLQDQGCDVEIVYSADTVEQPVVAALLRTGGRHGAIKVHNGRLDRDHDGVLDLYVHSKYVLINGVYGTRNNVKAVYTGSPNFTSNSLRQSNEIALRIGTAAAYSAFNANFNLIRDKWTVPVTTIPKATAQQPGRSDGVAGDRDDDYWVSPDE